MEANKILSANFLDLVFDGRNKEYGAYELRVTYPQRVKKSMILVLIIAAVAIGGVALANSFKPGKEGKLSFKTVKLVEIPDEIHPVPSPPKKSEPSVQLKTAKLTTAIRMVKENFDQLPTQDDFKISAIGAVKQDGPDDTGPTKPNDIDGKGIIPVKLNDVPEQPFRKVEVEARFDGNWEKFLMKNLNAEVTADNNAPAGTYKVIIEFVVDTDGSVSKIIALTNHGYGLEQEAIRVLKKADKWVPANQNGKPVKAYRLQPIIFEVTEGQ